MAISLVVIGLTVTVVSRAEQDPGLVPISWALDVRNGHSRNVAVAVPWHWDYSHWQAMKQPVLFRFFPHVSLLGSSDAKAATLTRSPHFAMGCGISLANAFAIGVGVQLDDPISRTYLMAGISLTDVLRLTF